jgi:hypothetical protein
VTGHARRSIAFQRSSATSDVMPRGYAADAAIAYAERAIAAAPAR